MYIYLYDRCQHAPPQSHNMLKISFRGIPNSRNGLFTNRSEGCCEAKLSAGKPQYVTCIIFARC